MSIEVVDAWDHKELSVLKCSVEEHFGASLSMNKYGISIMGSAQPKGRAVPIRSVTIQVFPINGAREKPASRKAMISAMRCKCG